MVLLKDLSLKNFRGYRDVKFDFQSDTGGIKKIALFYGPNGVGKSKALEATQLVCNVFGYENRDTDLVFRKLTYHKNYDPSKMDYEDQMLKMPTGVGFGMTTQETKDRISSNINIMEVNANFTSESGNKNVFLSTAKSRGVIKNDLERKPGGYCFFLDADSPANMNKFQIPESRKEIFLDMAQTVYGLKCELDKKVEVLIDKEIETDVFGDDKSKKYEIKRFKENFYTDLIIHKYGDMVHFKCMSDGEKKIAKLAQNLCGYNLDNKDIVCIDNVFMHIYYKRHAKIIDKIFSLFENKQFLLTTHSGTAIEYVRQVYGEEYLYDIEKYKLKDLGIDGSEIIS